MRMDDFILIRFLWQFEALRQANKKTTSKSDELISDSTLPATGDYQTIRHDKELKQDYGNKPNTKQDAPKLFVRFDFLITHIRNKEVRKRMLPR